jgi:hypothetical protein
MSLLEADLNTLHLALLPNSADQPLTLHAMGLEYQLEPHTAATLKQHRQQNRALGAIPESQLGLVTHFAENVQLSRTAVGIYYVTQPAADAQSPMGDMIALSIHVPTESRRIAAGRRMRAGGTAEMPDLLHHLGAEPSLLRGDKEAAFEVMSHSALFLSPLETAKSIIFQHPEIASLNPEIAADMLDLYIERALRQHPDLWQYISAHPPGGSDPWQTTGFAMNLDGTRVRPTDDLVDKEGKPIPWPKGPDGEPCIPQSSLSDGVVAAAKLAVDHVLRATKNAPSLYGAVWQRSLGIPATQDKQGVSIPRAALLKQTVEAANDSPGAGAEVYKWTLANSGSSWGLDVNDSIDFDAATQQVKIRIRNKSNRCLGAYAEFLNSAEQPMVPAAWESRMREKKFEPSPTKKYLAFVRPVDCIFGIPANIFKSELTISFPFIEGATRANVLLGGLGCENTDVDVSGLGILCTGTLCYGLPGLMIGFGVGMDSSAFYFSLFTNPVVLELLLGVFAEGGEYWLSTWDILFLLKKIAGSLPTIIFSKAVAAYVVKPLLARVFGAQAAQAMPIAGWVVKVLSLTAAGGMMISTTVAINNSPGTYSLNLSRAIDVKVLISPDPTHGGDDAIWPSVFDHFELNLKNQSGASQPFGPGRRKDLSSALEHTFLNVPAGKGENIQITANLYAANGWLCGVWVSDWINAVTTDGTTTLTVRGSIIENLAPLSADTTYSHKQKLAMDGQKHVWRETTTAPSEVWRPEGTPGAIEKLVNLTSNNHAYRVGYTWMAEKLHLPLDTGTTPTDVKMYAFQCISTLADPDKGSKQPGRGFSRQPYLSFDQFGPEPTLMLPLSALAALDNASVAVSDDIRKAFSSVGRALPPKVAKKIVTPTAEWLLGTENSQTWLFVIRRQPAGIAVFPYPTPAFSPRNFYLDSRSSAEGKLHLRHVDLTDPSTQFDYNTGKSWGAFRQTNLDAVIIHPRGYAIGVSYQNHKMEIVQLPQAAKADADAPVAIPMSGRGAQEGLLHGPKAMTVTADGRVLVLEQTNSRVQAFDTTGNAVQCFAGTLAFDMAETFRSSLGKREVSAALAAVLQSNTVPTTALLAAFSTDDIPDLDAGKFTERMQKTLLLKGLTLAGTSSITVIKPGSIWLLRDPATEFSFDLRSAAGEVAVRRPSEWGVEVQSKDSRWVLRDATNAQSYRVLHDDVSKKLKVRQLISTMGLKDKTDNLEYLDIACEPEGFIYVLSYLRPGEKLSDYRLDIYNPDGTHLARTPKNSGDPGVNAAKISVDHWRTLFTLNYETILGPGGRPEPSISQWAPSVPPAV